MRRRINSSKRKSRFFEKIHCIKLENAMSHPQLWLDERFTRVVALAKRKCNAEGGCKKDIPKGDVCVECWKKEELPSRTVWKKKNYCLECGRERIKRLNARIGVFLKAINK